MVHTPTQYRSNWNTIKPQLIGSVVFSLSLGVISLLSNAFIPLAQAEAIDLEYIKLKLHKITEEDLENPECNPRTEGNAIKGCLTDLQLQQLDQLEEYLTTQLTK